MWLRHKSEKLYMVIQKLLCIIVVFVVTPASFIFQMFIIRPKVQKAWELSFPEHCFHVLLVTYIFINVFGNMVFSLVVNSDVKNRRLYKGRTRFCEHCKRSQPEDSWHCGICNTCVLQRDHHCYLLSNCIGRYNLRYFVCFLAHVTMSFVLSIYYNYHALENLDMPGLMDITIMSAHFLMSNYISISQCNIKECLHEWFWFMNIVAFILCGTLLWFHLGNALRGVTSYENKLGKIPRNVTWRRNMVRAFGKRWYLAIFWPFVDSPIVNEFSKNV